MSAARVLPALASAVLVAVALTGCGVADVLQKQTTGEARSAAELQHAWSTPAAQPDWVPADASRIRWIAATGGGAGTAPATVRVDSSSALPAGCTEVPRRSLDSFGPSWAPKRFPDRIARCGDWAVMPVRGGWFGWTPLAPGER